MSALRLAARQLARSPSFSLVVVLTLALGLGACTLIFSVIDAVLLEPLPYPDPDRIVRVQQVDKQGRRFANMSDPNFFDLKEQSRAFAAFAQLGASIESVAGGSEPARLVLADVSREFFAVLGTEPLLGRTFVPEEQHEGGAPSALISYRYWQRYLAGTPELEARSLRIGNRVYSIVGVMPPGFDYPDGADVWVPRERWPVFESRTAHNFQSIGRLAPDVSLQQAREALGVIARDLKRLHGDDTRMADVAVVPLHESLVGRVRPALAVLAAAAVLLLLISCVNTLSMLLARTAVREQELAVRLALGAGRRRLAAQFFAEALVLCGAGAAFAVLLAWLGTRLLGALDVSILPRASGIGVDWATSAFAAALALLSAGCLSLAAAWQASVDAGALRAGRRVLAGGRRSRVRDVLVATQIAMALVLVVGSLLLGRSLMRLADVDPGFDTAGAVLMNVAMPWPRDNAERLRLVRFYDAVIERLRELPGVEAVGGTTVPPLRGNGTNGTFVEQRSVGEIASLEDLDAILSDRSRAGYAEYRVASDGYFAALRIPVLRGRAFEPADGPEDPVHAAVVSRSLAESQWPGEDPIGKLIQFGNMDGDITPFTIVGVVGDVRDYGLDGSARPTVYVHYRQRPQQAGSFWIAARGPQPERFVPAAREIVRSLDPDVPPEFVASDELFASALARPRFNLVMLSVFGGAALVLALAGIYGAIAFYVAQRTHEIGVRMALGARSGGIALMVIRRSVVLAAAGVAAGLVAALGASRLIGSLLYGVAPHDGVTYASAGALLLASAAAAAWFPALRAARMDPTTALREE